MSTSHNESSPSGWWALATHPITVGVAIWLFIPVGIVLMLMNPKLRKDRRWWAGAAAWGVCLLWLGRSQEVSTPSDEPAASQSANKKPETTQPSSEQSVTQAEHNKRGPASPSPTPTTVKESPVTRPKQQRGDRRNDGDAALLSILQQYDDKAGGRAVELYSATDDINHVMHVVIRSPIRGSDLQWLESLPHLERLDLLSDQITSWDHLPPLSDLRILLMEPPGGQAKTIPSDKLAALAGAWPSLEAVSLRNIRGGVRGDSVDAYISALAAFPNLRYLKYSEMSPQATAIHTSLSRLRGLEVLAWKEPSITSANTGGVLEACTGHPTLKVLDLTETRLSAEAKPTFGPLESCPNLEALLLGHVSGVTAENLLTLKALKEIWVQKNRLDDTCRIEMNRQRPGVLRETDTRSKEKPPTFEERLPALSRPTKRVRLNSSGKPAFVQTLR